MSTRTTHTHLVELVRLRMADDALTTSEAARRAGIHRAELWYFLNGRRHLRSDKLLAVLLSLGIRIAA